MKCTQALMQQWHHGCCPKATLSLMKLACACFMQSQNDEFLKGSATLHVWSPVCSDLKAAQDAIQDPDTDEIQHQNHEHRNRCKEAANYSQHANLLIENLLSKCRWFGLQTYSMCLSPGFCFFSFDIATHTAHV